MFLLLSHYVPTSALTIIIVSLQLFNYIHLIFCNLFPAFQLKISTAPLTCARYLSYYSHSILYIFLIVISFDIRVDVSQTDPPDVRLWKTRAGILHISRTASANLHTTVIIRMPSENKDRVSLDFTEYGSVTRSLSLHKHNHPKHNA